MRAKDAIRQNGTDRDLHIFGTHLVALWIQDACQDLNTGLIDHAQDYSGAMAVSKQAEVMDAYTLLNRRLVSGRWGQPIIGALMERYCWT